MGFLIAVPGDGAAVLAFAAMGSQDLAPRPGEAQCSQPLEPPAPGKANRGGEKAWEESLPISLRP